MSKKDFFSSFYIWICRKKPVRISLAKSLFIEHSTNFLSSSMVYFLCHFFIISKECNFWVWKKSYDCDATEFLDLNWIDWINWNVFPRNISILTYHNPVNKISHTCKKTVSLYSFLHKQLFINIYCVLVIAPCFWMKECKISRIRNEQKMSLF